MQALTERSCVPLPKGTPPLTQPEIDAALEQLQGWQCRDGAICRIFSFKDFSETMRFVNAVAGIAAREDHHPEMLVGYGTCRIAYSTHSVGGVSHNDFICAAKIEALCATPC
jgi:4a-hydroxytetrahydrobiopterin dehydratase